MEVGPLNNMGLPVKGPTEGQPGRASERTTNRNRLVGDETKAAAKSSDKADIAARATNLEDLQGKIALASTAQKAVLRLIQAINDTGQGTKDANAAAKEIKKATSQEFNGKPVFNGDKLVHQGADGSRTVADVPDKNQLEKMAADALKGKQTGEGESQAFKEINHAHKQLTDLIADAKADLKQQLSKTNQRASMAAVKDTDSAEKLIAQMAKSKPDTVPYNRAYGDMTAKVVKLLK